MPGFQWIFLGFLHYFIFANSATSSMRVKINFRIKLIPGQDDLFSQAIFILTNDKALNILFI